MQPPQSALSQAIPHLQNLVNLVPGISQELLDAGAGINGLVSAEVANQLQPLLAQSQAATTQAIQAAVGQSQAATTQAIQAAVGQMQAATTQAIQAAVGQIQAQIQAAVGQMQVNTAQALQAATGQVMAAMAESEQRSAARTANQGMGAQGGLVPLPIVSVPFLLSLVMLWFPLCLLAWTQGGAVPANFPATAQAVGHMASATLNGLLLAYGLPVNVGTSHHAVRVVVHLKPYNLAFFQGPIANRRQQLLSFIGFS